MDGVAKRQSSFEDLEMMAPPPKRLELDSNRVQHPAQPWSKPPVVRQPSSTGQTSVSQSEFPLRSLEEFYKACPSYRLPVEIGSFSLDENGQQKLDRSELKYFSPPSHGSRMDLKVGYEKYVPSKRNVPSDKLNPILRWINANGDCFRPKSTGPKSPDKSGLSDSGSGATTNGADLERRTSIGELGGPVPTTITERPDDLLTNFVTWRGMLTKMMCSPYNKSEPWKMAATLYNKTIYLSEVETEHARIKTANESPRMKEMSYWGLKFEDYVTSTEPPDSLSSPKSASLRTGTVNSERAFCSIVRTRMNTHSVVMAAEVDCCDHTQKVNPPQNYIELKTNRVILTDRNKSSFRTYKLLKWWAQSFLVGVPKIVCGFRDDDGVVKNLQHFKTTNLAHDTQTDLSLWQPAVCLNFLDELLSWIRTVVTSDGPRSVYMLSWEPPYKHVTCVKCPDDDEHAFLPDWFIKKQQGPVTGPVPGPSPVAGAGPAVPDDDNGTSEQPDQ